MKTVQNFFYYSNTLPKILFEAGITVAFSTYQAGKLIFVSSANGETLIKYAKNFKRPMGLAYDPADKQLAVASIDRISVFSTQPGIAKNYPENESRYDALFIPQYTSYTGLLDTHELSFGEEGLYFVNTKFSSLCTLSPHLHFKTIWQPPFVDELMPEDRCHLNGMAMANGRPKYVSMFAKTNSFEGWKKMPKDQGLIMDVENGNVISEKLTMPHSPVIKDRSIYFLQSGTGQVMKTDLDSGVTEEIYQFNSFLRGLEVVGDYLFVGASELREKSTSFGQLPISDKETVCGLFVIHRHSGQIVASLNYTDKVKEIFSLKVLGFTQPALLTERDEDFNRPIMGGKGLNFWLNRFETE